MKLLAFLQRRAGVLLAAMLVAPLTAPAGMSADAQTGVDKFGAEAIRAFTLKLNDALDQRRVNVAIIARTGRPRSTLPRGVHYTHVAFAVFEPVKSADGSVYYTYTFYNLYQQGPGHEDQSYLKQDVTYNFVAGVAEPDLAVCVPTETLQRRILAVIRSPAYRALYNPDYNLFANPWVDRYDNCATHTLKVCVAAIYRTDDRRRIYDDIRAYFRPTPIHLGFMQSLGAGFMKAIRHDDTDPDGYQTATYDSIEAFLATNRLERESFIVRM